MSKSKIVSSVVKPTFASIVMDEGGKLVPYRLNSTHPTFGKLVCARRRKNFARVPALLDAAQESANQSQGNVLIKKGGVYYQARKVDNGLTRKIGELMAPHAALAMRTRFMDTIS